VPDAFGDIFWTCFGMISIASRLGTAPTVDIAQETTLGINKVPRKLGSLGHVVSVLLHHFEGAGVGQDRSVLMGSTFYIP